MKKSKKIIFSLIIMLLIIPLFFSSKSLTNTNTNDNSLALVELKENAEMNHLKDLVKETFSEEYAEKIKKNTEATQKAERIESQFEISNKGEIIYPDNFGGVYINEHDDLVVQIVHNNKNYKFLEYTFNNKKILLDDDIIIEYVENSYEDLKTNDNIIINYFLKNGVKNENFATNYIDVINNKVIVELINVNSEEIQKFKDEIINSDMIEFKKGN